MRMCSYVAAIALVMLVAGCDHNPLFAGALGQDCEPPRATTSDFGPSTSVLRMSNCQAKGTLCCRASAQATRTTCQYPEDCYVAPYHGQCATPVDCSDTQSCTGGACACTRGGPHCPSASTAVVTCCAANEVCNNGMCSAPLDGGT